MDIEKFYAQFPLGSHLYRKPMPAMSERSTTDAIKFIDSLIQWRKKWQKKKGV